MTHNSIGKCPVIHAYGCVEIFLTNSQRWRWACSAYLGQRQVGQGSGGGRHWQRHRWLAGWRAAGGRPLGRVRRCLGRLPGQSGRAGRHSGGRRRRRTARRVPAVSVQQRHLTAQCRVARTPLVLNRWRGGEVCNRQDCRLLSVISDRRLVRCNVYTCKH